MSSASNAIGQKAPSAKRCIMTSGAAGSQSNGGGQKAPSAKRCIKTRFFQVACCFRRAPSQKAPSAKRCIKT